MIRSNHREEHKNKSVCFERIAHHHVHHFSRRYLAKSLLLLDVAATDMATAKLPSSSTADHVEWRWTAMSPTQRFRR